MTALLYEPVAIIFCQLSLAVIFGLGAWGKFRDLEEFTGIVRNYRLLPEFAIRPVAYLMPVLEAMIAVTLLLGTVQPYPAMGAFVLLAIFAVAMGINILRGRRYIDCGCFRTKLKQRLSWWLVVRNGLLMAMSAVLVVTAGSPGMTRPIALLDVYTGTMATIVVVLFYVVLGHVLSEAPKFETR
jgi:hypothetical protein